MELLLKRSRWSLAGRAAAGSAALSSTLAACSGPTFRLRRPTQPWPGLQPRARRHAQAHRGAAARPPGGEGGRPQGVRSAPSTFGLTPEQSVGEEGVGYAGRSAVLRQIDFRRRYRNEQDRASPPPARTPVSLASGRPHALNAPCASMHRVIVVGDSDGLLRRILARWGANGAVCTKNSPRWRPIRACSSSETLPSPVAFANSGCRH